MARAVAEVVGLQRSARIDVVSDGETGKTSYSTYVVGRLTGFGGVDDMPFLGRGRRTWRISPATREVWTGN